MKRSVLILLVAAVALTAAVTSAQPRVSNGELQASPIRGALTRAVIENAAGKTGTAWVGYGVPIAAGDHQMCCWNGDQGGCCAGCRLERGIGPSFTTAAPAPGPVRLEAAANLLVLYRVENGIVSRIRIFSEDCPLDAGGLTLHWLNGVRPADSVTVLAAFTDATAERRVADGALSALAMHAEPAALDRLAAAARTGATTHVRGQALFWLAQRAGEKAAGVISEAIARDPETEVKRRAVFALSQLPNDEGVPLLIQVARTNTNPAVRKQAMFWLGQSRDPRALRFFEEILFK